MKKRFIFLLILSVLAILIAGCAEKQTIEKVEKPTPTQTPEAKEEVVKIEINVSDVEEAIEEIVNIEKELANLENITFEDI